VARVSRAKGRWAALVLVMAFVSVPPSGGDASAQGVDQATRAAQNDLRDLGFDPGTIDGRWGPRSLAALRRFQRGEGLPESGRADPDTLARLRQRSRQPSAASPIAKAPEPDATARSPLPSVGVAQVPDPDARAKESPAPTSSAQDAIDSDSPDGHTGGAKAAAPSVSGQASGESRANAPNPAAEPRSQAPGTSSQSPAPAFPLATLALVGAIVPGALLAAWGVRRRRRQLVPSTPETIDAGLRDGEPAPSTGLPREAPVGLRAARPAASNHVAVIPEPRTPMADPSPMTGLVGSTEVPAPDAVADPPADDPIEATDRSGAIDPGQGSGEPPRAGPAPASNPFVARSPETADDRSCHPPAIAPRSPDAAAPPRASEPATRPSKHRLAGDRTWVPAGVGVAVAGLTLPGLVYVGRTLPPAKGGEQNDNCLVDPGLAVPRTTSDTAGRHLEYCPSYGSMKPSSRRAYLEWLAGDRAAPGTPIGYVFLYLYGLERRGVLEGSAEDRPAIRAEVERLLSVYGDNGSFRHYASCLLAALDALSLVPGTDPAPVFEPSGYELPLSVRFAVGSRIRDGKPVEGVWLLAWTMSHPETRVRTPARRAFDRVRDEFVAEFERRHPSGGLPIKWRKGAPSPALYRAASRTFEVDLALFGSERMPDLARHADALALGRELLDLSSDRLDAYSRHLGKEAGRASPLSLQALALLPAGQRERAADAPAAAHLSWLRERAEACAPVPLAELGRRVAGRSDAGATAAKPRELADVLCRFGIGLIPDPRFPVRAPAADVTLFALTGPRDAVDAPSAAYEAAFLTLSVGMLMARADGVVTEDERAVLRDLASDAPGLGPDERLRLGADASWLEAHPTELTSMRARLAGLDPERKRAVADTLVRVASSDGRHHRAEIALLEKAFRQMGLDLNGLYSALHGAAPAAAPDGPVLVARGPAREAAFLIPGGPEDGREPSGRAAADASRRAERGPPAPAGRVDAERLAAIRSETEAVSSVLAGVFDLDADPIREAQGAPPEAEPAPMAAPGAPDGGFDGLDARLAGLMRALAGRPEWPRDAFDRLARERGLMPGAAMEDLNAWSFDRFDDPLVEEGDPVLVNVGLIPAHLLETA
jgi:peptidoglycan hydrolase-like protein with peptidoglycan-binding domain/uncharacterized tellurite resistance protein B-like protein